MQSNAGRSASWPYCLRAVWPAAVLIFLILPSLAWSQTGVGTRVYQADPPAAPPSAGVVANGGLRPQTAASVYSIGNPTDEEQLWLEMVNYERANPQAEGQILNSTTDADVVAAYAFFSVDLSAMVTAFNAIPAAPPLSMNAELLASATGHSQDMLANVYQGHTGSDGSTLQTRIAAQGYNGSTEGENVFATATSVFYGNAAYEVDWTTNPPSGMQNPPGHRNNDHSSGFAEVGIGVVDGTASESGTTVGPLVCTMDFGRQSTYTPFVTGVVYYDINGNGSYDIGEGLGGVSVSVSGATVSGSSANSGGYSVPVSGAGSKTVTFSVSGLAAKQVDATLTGTSNVKVDLKLTYSPPVVTGASNPGVGQDSNYQFSTLPGATSYQVQQSQLVPFTTVETGGGGTGDFTSTTTGSYSVVATAETFNGVASFHLAHPTADEQVLALNPILVAGSSSMLEFESLLGYATSTEIAKAQVSADGGATWQDVWTEAGSNGSGETSFTAQSISLSQYANKEIMIRFVYDATGSYYNTLNTGVGFYLDNIQVTSANSVTNTQVSSVTSGNTFVLHPVAAGSYALAVQALAGSRVFPYGPIDQVVATGTGGLAPTVVTNKAHSVGFVGAVLSGSVNPNGAASSTFFQWGSDTTYGATTATVSVGSGTSAVMTSATLSSLTSGSTYHFRAVAVNVSGSTNGQDQMFTTAAMTGDPPTVTTNPATSVAATSAILNGQVNPNGIATSAIFETGTDTTYGTKTASVSIGSGSDTVVTSATLSSLAPNTTYHFRVEAVNASGTSDGLDQMFTTGVVVNNAPIVTTGSATDIAAASATLNGTVDPNGADTSIFFEYGQNTSYGSQSLTTDVGSGAGTLSVFYNAIGLKPATIYHFRLTGSNSSGTVHGGDQMLTTGTQISFAAFKAKYVGLIESKPAANATAGILTVSVSAKGTFTASGKLGGKALSFSGNFDADGRYSATLKSGVQVALQLATEQVAVVTGSVTTGGVASNINLNPVVENSSTVELTYRMPHTTGTGLPQGNGYGTLKLPAGATTATFSGKLGDATVMSLGASVVIDGSNAALSMIPVYEALYGGKGSISGLLTRESTVNGDLDGVLNWFKPQTTGVFFTAPFSTQVNLYGSLYVKPVTGSPAIALTTGTVSFGAGDLTNPPFQKKVTLGTNNKITVTAPGADKLKMSITTATGLFSGTFIDPDTGKSTAFSGALIQGGFNIGTGVFKGPTDPGSVDLQ